MRRYGQTAGNKKGSIENTLLCVHECWGHFTSYQCQRKRGHGPKGEYCWQHNPKRVKKLQDERCKKYNDEMEKEQSQHERNSILNKMAKGISTKQLSHYHIIERKRKVK